MCVYVCLERGRVAEAAAPARAGTVAAQLPIGSSRAETATRQGTGRLHRDEIMRISSVNLNAIRDYLGIDKWICDVALRSGDRETVEDSI